MPLGARTRRKRTCHTRGLKIRAAKVLYREELGIPAWHTARGAVDIEETQREGVGRPLPPEPTRYAPGTPEKVAVMRSRYLAGYHIHHPQDASDVILDGLRGMSLWQS